VIIGSRLIRAVAESDQPAAAVRAVVAQFAAGLADSPAAESTA